VRLSPNIEPAVAARLVQPSGVEMNPVSDVVITQVFHRSGGTGACDRRLGGVVALVGSARSCAARDPAVGLALGVLDQPADLRNGNPADGRLRRGFQVRPRCAMCPIGQALGMVFLFGVVFVLIEGPGWWAKTHASSPSRHSLLRLRVPAITRPGVATRHRPGSSGASPFASATMIAGVRICRVGGVPVMMSCTYRPRWILGDAHGLSYLPLQLAR